MFTSSAVEVFTQLMLSLLADGEITLLDADFSPKEISDLDIEPKDLQKRIKTEFSGKIHSKADLIDRIQAAEYWRIHIYTSGTTGLPKKISHSFQSLTRAVRVSESKQEDVWGFCYNPTHIAGLQVFFQAFLNGNAIINLFRFGKQEIIEAISRYGISNISATPTFYRLLLPLPEKFESVTRLTSGGERFDPEIIKKLKPAFPNARITNIYASTEAGTLLSSEGDLFRIRPEFEDLLKIENEELYVHHSLTGAANGGEWFATGDLVEIVETNPLAFRFKHRRDELLKVGGYKVDPTEVEAVLNQYPGIENCRVYGKSNSVIGTILLCDVVARDKNIAEAELIGFLKEWLQSFKIPRMFNFVEEIALTRSGKLKRSG